MCFFFFQAEDGIRDVAVTGVQTCALPIYDPEAAPNALKLTQEAAPRLGIRLQVAPVGAAEELLPELTLIAKERHDALFVYPDVVLRYHPRPQQIADFALKATLPTMNAFRLF